MAILRTTNSPGHALNARAPIERSPGGIRCLHCRAIVPKMTVLQAGAQSTTVACPRCHAAHVQYLDGTHALGRHPGAPLTLHT